MNLVVVGAGALGSHVVLAARHITPVITVIDFDRIESKNVQAQFHGKMAIGQNKAIALSKLMRQLFGSKVEGRSAALCEQNIGTLLPADSLVIDCTDNYATRTLIQNYALANGIPCIHACLAASGDYARVVWSHGFVADEETNGQATCEDGRHLPFYIMVATVISSILEIYIGTGVAQNCSITKKALLWF